MSQVIMVVDDLISNAIILEGRLVRAGFNVTIALSGEECLAKVARSPPSLILGLLTLDDAVLAHALPSMTRANPDLLASGTYFVALDEDHDVIARGGWTTQQPGNGEVQPATGHIQHFATHPRSVRKGAARAIYGIVKDRPLRPA